VACVKITIFISNRCTNLPIFFIYQYFHSVIYIHDPGGLDACHHAGSFLPTFEKETEIFSGPGKGA